MKSPLINGDHPPLHKNKQCLPLERFDNSETKSDYLISRNIDSSDRSSFILIGILLLHEFYILLI